MIKTVAFMPRRADLDRAAFRAYYEKQHARLALQHFRFARYVRNHLADDQEPGFDCVSEFWHRDWEHTMRQMAGDSGAVMIADELNFLDRAATRAAFAEEHLLAGPPRTYETGSAKTILLLRAGPDVDRTALPKMLRQRAEGCGDRITMDLLSPLDSRPLPCDALVSFWGKPAAPVDPPPGWTIAAALDAVAEETPDTELAPENQPAV